MEEEACGRPPSPDKAPSPDKGLREEERNLLERILGRLMREQVASYIVLCEFLAREGELCFRDQGAMASPRWGFYSELAERWRCSPNTIKSWLARGLRFLAQAGREARGRSGPRAPETTP